MKKINTLEANAIVGGKHAKVCVVGYARGDGGACMKITTCQDKHGRIVSQNSAKVDTLSCDGLP